MTRLIVVSATFLLFTSIDSQTARADDQNDASPQSVLVNTLWLQDHLSSPLVRILELGPDIRQFREGHIPGAQFVHWIDDITEPTDRARYTVAPPKMIEALLCRLGIQNQTTIVLYDDLNSRVSARMFWTLRYFGHKDIRILDGGRRAWSRAGQALAPSSDLNESAEPTKYKIVSRVKKHRIRLKQVRKHLEHTDVSIIDARAPAQYAGEQPGTVYHTGKPHAQLGHIPGAVNILWKENFRADGTFKSVDKLQQLYEQNGVNPERKVITYCNEGLHAAPPWFVLTELLGYHNVHLYDESMAEWANNSNLPIRVGDQP